MTGDPRVVCDASSLAEFVVGNETGFRVGSYLQDVELHLPDLVYVEAANVLRKGERRSLLSVDATTEVLAYLLVLDVEVWGFHDVADRAWELRHNVTPYDAVYVALAEQLDATLITLDERLKGALGIRCEVIVP